MGKNVDIPAAAQWESINAAAVRTGFSPQTIRLLISEGRLPAYRVTNKPKAAIRLRISDVDDLFTPVVPADVYD